MWGTTSQDSQNARHLVERLVVVEGRPGPIQMPRPMTGTMAQAANPG